MADFLVILGTTDTAERWRAHGPTAAGRLGAGTPAARGVAGARTVAWAWPRRDGSGGTLVADERGWLLAAGSWFGAEGLSSGAEAALLARIRAHGVDTVAAELDGFFTLVLGASTEPQRVTVLTDPVGSHLTHLRRDAGGAAALAASPLWLAALDDAVPAPDPVGCQEFLATGVIYEQRTLFAGIERLPPSSVLEIDAADGVRAARPSWRPAALAFDSLRGDDAVEAFGAGVRSAVRRIASRGERPVCDLTAGWDSRLLLAFLLDAGVPVETTVTGAAGTPDVEVSARIAAACGLRHHVVPTPAAPDVDALHQARDLCDGEVDVLDFARIAAVQRALLPRFGPSWNGSFGEVARGYWWEVLAPSPQRTARRLDATAVARARYAHDAQPLTLWPADTRLSDTAAHLAAVIARCDADLDTALPLGCRMDHVYLRLRMRCWQGRIASSTDRLRACLSPLGFRSVLEPLLQTTPRDRAGNRLARRALARFAPRLAALPLESGGPALPCTAANAWRFTPELLRFARRATRKVLRGSAWTPPTFGRDARRTLWHDARFTADFGDAGALLLGEHVDRDRLQSVLVASQRPEFAAEPLFGRLLALELALRGARQARPPA